MKRVILSSIIINITINCYYYLYRIFDDDEDGKIYAADMVEVLTSFGEKFTKSEARKLVQNEDNTGEGLIDYEGDIIMIINYCHFAFCLFFTNVFS